jgi:hypothetical protein
MTLDVKSGLKINDVLVIDGNGGYNGTAAGLNSPVLITISGDGSGFVSFDGTQSVTIPLTLKSSGVIPGTYNLVTVDEKGIITFGEIVESSSTLQNLTDVNLSSLSDKDHLIYDLTSTKWKNVPRSEIIANVQTLALAPLNPLNGDLWYNTIDENLYIWDEDIPAWINVSSVTAVAWGTIIGDISTQTDLQLILNTKVDKIAGKGLSTEDYTTPEKTKLAGIQPGAQVNSVISVSGLTGAVVLTKNEVGLSNVQNVDQTNATNLTSGTISISRLGTNTPDNTKVLFGDNTWKNITEWQTSVISTNQTLSKNNRYIVLTAGLTLTLPASPAINDIIWIAVGGFTNTIINRNGSNIMNLAQNLTINIANSSLQLIYVNGTYGWKII